MWQIVANLEFVTGFAIDLQTRKPNISPRDSCVIYTFLQEKRAHKNHYKVKISSPGIYNSVLYK